MSVVISPTYPSCPPIAVPVHRRTAFSDSSERAINIMSEDREWFLSVTWLDVLDAGNGIVPVKLYKIPIDVFYSRSDDGSLQLNFNIRKRTCWIPSTIVRKWFRDEGLI